MYLYPFKQLGNWITTSPSRFFFTAFFVSGSIILYLDQWSCRDSTQWNAFWVDILVEAHGLLFDLIVFGILLSIYDALRSKNDRITRNEEEIEDFRSWDEKEAMYRIVGAIKRLNKEKVSKMALYNCNLNEADLQDRILDGSDMVEVKLQNADLRRAQLCKAVLMKAQLNNSNLEGANLEGASLLSANLRNAKFGGANMAKTDLRGAQINGSTFVISDSKINFDGISHLASLSEAKVSTQDWIQKLKIWKVIGADEIAENYYIDSTPIIEPGFTQRKYFLVRKK